MEVNMTIAIDLEDVILANVTLIAGKHNAIVGMDFQTCEISAEKFNGVGELVFFKNDVEAFLSTLKLRRFGIRTIYNPYQVIIDWGE
jgi:hypothetical protein